MSAALFATNKVLRGMPAESMRNSNNMDIIAKKPLIEKSDFLWSKISYYWRWVLRDISRNKIRFIMGIIKTDEVNRASPKTQSALLEVMEESQVKVIST